MPNIRLGSSDYLSRGELDGFAAYLSSSDYLRGASGPLVSLPAGETLSLGAGAFTLAGQDATFVRTYVTPAEAGVFTLAGQSAGFLFGTKLEAGAGSFVLSGQFLGFGNAPGSLSLTVSHGGPQVALTTILIS